MLQNTLVESIKVNEHSPMARCLWILVLVLFVCLISNHAESSESADIEEDDIDARLGSTTTVVCVVTSANTGFVISWTFDHYDPAIREIAIKRSSKYTIDWSSANKYNFKSILKIVNVTYDDQGRYTCRYGNLWNTANVVVEGRPVITNTESKINGNLGSEMTLTCTAQVRNSLVNSTPNLTWIRSDQKSLQDYFNYMNVPTYNAFQPVFKTVLTIYELTAADLGTYVCRISNKYGSAEWRFSVTAVPALKITVPETSITTVTLYDTQSFKCRVSNIQDTNSVKWYLGRERIKEMFGSTNLRSYTEARGFTIYELFFVSMSLEDEGTYSCKWKKLHDSRYLHVIGSLGIKATQNEVVTAPGSEITLECSVKSRPISVIQWYFGNQKLISDTKYIIITTKVSDIYIKSALTIRNVVVEHFGNGFVCVSNNTMGELFTDGIRVTDVNECKTGQHDCDLSREVCVDTLEAYSCECRKQFQRVGLICQAISRSSSTTTSSPTTKSAPSTAADNALVIGLVIGLCLIGLFALVGFVVCCVYRRFNMKKLINISRSASTGVYNTTFDVMSEEAHIYTELTPGSGEFPRDRLRFQNLLGEGKFGKVVKAEALDILGLKTWDEVAVKMVKETATDAEKEDFYHELLIVRKIPRYINVVAFLGCCTVGEPTLMIMEYVSGGDLLTYLRKCRPKKETAEEQCLTQKDLLSFAFQTARGLRHLESNKIVHRDVAARNVLVNKDKVCKISDFGLARDIEGTDLYERTSKGPLPIRWMSPESLRDSIHTHKSDVWAYGVLLWEIVTLGSSPYPGMSGKQVMTFVLERRTQEFPPQCKEEICKIMHECWEFNAVDRPSFHEIVQILERLLEEEGNYIKLENMEDGIYMILEESSAEENI